VPESIARRLKLSSFATAGTSGRVAAYHDAGEVN
jgi:hypothetical protein